MSDSVQTQSVAAVIILAAGGGTRMKSNRSKLLHEVGGRSMLDWAVRAAEGVRPERLMVVVGHLADQVTPHLQEIAPEAATATQAEQRGTGHAVECGLAALGEITGEVVVTYGDVPLLAADTLLAMVGEHRAAGNAITVLTARVPDPTGYGRILRDADDTVAGIVEHKDADETQRGIDEINSGIYVFDAAVLRAGLARLEGDNAQGELYLTDVLGIARGDGDRVGAYRTDDLWQTEGVNDRVQLARMNAELNRRILEGHMRAGVTVLDPATTWVSDDVSLGTDVTLHPGTTLAGATTVGDGAEIGPDTRLRDTAVGAGATVLRTEANLATIGPRAVVGPFSYLRPGAELGEGAKVGAFVEVKASTLGPGAKAPHLSYLGDATIGAGANIGAGTIVANYDGVAKYPTVVGEASFVGSGSVLVAPVDIADGSYIAAGSTVTDGVEPGQLAVARGRQRNVDGWVARRRAGTRTEAAADRARAAGTPHPGVERDTDGRDES
ncbi:bifunctional UDP-N-acetylglucosamine pyrophosphorylase/glucosamine-1-phosphate N-acetyltransferase [Naumannella cuiyingiana]|uniref:Bifunctional protein GlmU n=1 Tax=Naumannella cuiyingiana TaxID=1347891 RepID=A0A7Z0ILQ2_9ACTN|nr:bifunctional UDP-N-acetylglucosamine pyrophosphorylase/glucosamine-1-phosphate N-acetyltransferase [Naumannella cuiyingiana]